MNALDIRLTRFILATVWLVTGALSLGIYPRLDSLSLLARIGLQGTPAVATLYFSATLDIALGIMTIFKHSRALWMVQAMLIVAYTLIISLWLPDFWLHPFGPILKNLPILMLLWLLYQNEGIQP